MAYKLSYKSSIANDLKRLGHEQINRLLKGIETRIVANPKLGKPLKGDFQGCYRYRFGDYRVIYTVTGSDILILRIGHRKEIYK